MISVQNVSKSFGSVKALDRVSFEVARGEVVGLLGPNGAGKTTMLRLITGFFPPTEGKILIDGVDLLHSKPLLRKKIGYLAEHNPLYEDMTTKDFLSHVAVLKRVPFRKRKQSISAVIERCKIGPVLNRLIGKLSKGYKQRIGLAQALLGEPELLILDEPTSGLDPKQIIEIRTLIQTLGRERTVLLSTHILPEVRLTCQRILILNEARLVASVAAPDVAPQSPGAQEFRVTLRGSWDQGDEFLRFVPGVSEVRLERDGGAERDYLIVAEHGKEIQSELARRILFSGFELLTLKPVEWNLEEIFMNVVTSEVEQ
ncbi:MAG: hypothetical protein A3G87_09735 [Omnitrophica bacterium RIFCSPLOWO2_12_FULL_50_11]|nr:MAG: hypothetical protein A3G87_09735 [Omnitrophica bacterium RIFCSPLOWO2_12_FULL_50_11]